MTSYHTRWERPATEADDPERLAIRESLAFGKALYDRRTALGLSVTDLAERAGMTADEIECIEEGGTEPHCRPATTPGRRARRRRASHRRPRSRLRLVRNPRRLTHPATVFTELAGN